MGRIFREFAVTIVIAIFASGLVSLTLTPLMCARLLKARGEGTKKTWMERVIGGIEERVLARLRRIALVVPASIAGSRAVIWVVCLAGTIVLLHAGAQGVPAAGRQQRDLWRLHRARRFVAARRCASCRIASTKCCTQDPNVITDFTMTGATGFLAANQGITFTFHQAARSSARRFRKWPRR